MTDAKIIISSDWKDLYDIPTLKEIFEFFGVKGEIIDVTETLWKIKYFSLDDIDGCRAEEIINYVKKHKIKKWIAIDDLPMQDLLPEKNFVHCARSNEGIKQSSIKEKKIKKLS